MNDIVVFSSLQESGSLEAICLEGSLESARHQQVETTTTTSETKGLALPAVPRPPLPELGEEVVQQSREAVTRTPEDRKSLRVRLETVRAAFNAMKPRRLHHGGRKDVLRTMATRAMTFVAEGKSASGNRLGRK